MSRQSVSSLSRSRHLDIGLFGLRNGQLGILDPDELRLGLELLGDLEDRLWHGGREHEGLAFLRDLPEDQFDVVPESHVQHLVGLVKDDGRYIVEPERAAVEVVHHATGRADHDVDAGLQGPQLALDRLAAVDRQDRDAGEVGEEVGELFCDLDREFPGRAEDDGLHDAACRVDLLDSGNAECCGFAGAGLCLGSHVTTGLDERNGECLDRRGLFEAHIFYCFPDLAREGKIGKLYTCIHIATPFGARSLKMAH